MKSLIAAAILVSTFSNFALPVSRADVRDRGSRVEIIADRNTDKSRSGAASSNVKTNTDTNNSSEMGCACSRNANGR